MVHLLEQLEVEVLVKRNDKFELKEIESFTHLLISPGPGLPAQAGKTMEAIAKYSESKSILGICLGMQAILESFGAKMTNMPQVEHGAQSVIETSNSGNIYKGLPSQITVGRYHSWAFQADAIPSEFKSTALSEDGYLMSVQHRILNLHGVQFHPESIMSQFGLEMMRNWLYS